MQARVLTLRFSPALGSFDDSELHQLTAEHQLLDLREHVVSVADEPCLVLLATWQQPTLAARSATADEASSTTEPRPNRARRPVTDLMQGLDSAQREQFEHIRAWRARTAHDEGVPPYVILTNRQLVEIVRQRPDSLAALGRIDGLGKKKLDRHGRPLLELLHAGSPDQVEMETDDVPPVEAADR